MWRLAAWTLFFPLLVNPDLSIAFQVVLRDAGQNSKKYLRFFSAARLTRVEFRLQWKRGHNPDQERDHGPDASLCRVGVSFRSGELHT